jgi:hypothetical protein
MLSEAYNMIIGGNFNISEYDFYKTLCPSDEWYKMLEKVLAKFEMYKKPPEQYSEILIIEDFQDKMIQYCMMYPTKILKFYKHINAFNYCMINSIFQTLIRGYAKKANEKTKYVRICKIIKLYKKVCGRTAAFIIFNELNETYSYRPTFLRELSELKNILI